MHFPTSHHLKEWWPSISLSKCPAWWKSYMLQNTGIISAHIEKCMPMQMQLFKPTEYCKLKFDTNESNVSISYVKASIINSISEMGPESFLTYSACVSILQACSHESISRYLHIGLNWSANSSLVHSFFSKP